MSTAGTGGDGGDGGGKEAGRAADNAEELDDRRVPFFDGLQAIAFAAALYGQVPVLWRPQRQGGVAAVRHSLAWVGPRTVSCFDDRKVLGCVPLGRPFRWAGSLRVSFHPLRSSLLLVLTVNVLAVWSCYQMVGYPLEAPQGRVNGDFREGLSLRVDLDESGALVIAARKTVRRLQQLSEVPARPDNLGERYVAVVSVQTGISYVVMVPLLLLEAKRLHRLEALTAPLTDVFGFVLHPARRSGVPVHVGMYCVQGCFFFGPLIVFLWITVLPGSAHTDWSHYPIGVLQMGHIYTLTTSFAGPSRCAGDFARLLAKQLQKELLRSTQMPAARLRQFRHAWLDLRALVDSLLVMPVSSIVYMVNLIALTSFMAYELSVAIWSDNISFAACMFAFTVIWLLTSLILCDSTHRAVESVRQNFLDVLLSEDQHCNRPAEARRELRMLTHMIATSRPTVSLAGLADFNRKTFATLLAAVATYVVVMLQFQQSVEQHAQA